MAGQHALPDVHVPQQIQNKPQLKKTSKPNQMSDYGFFKKYEDEERPGQMSYEGLLEFLGDLEIDGQSDESLFLCYVMESKELGVVTDAEFNGLHKKLGVSDNGQLKHALKKRIAAIRESSQDEQGGGQEAPGGHRGQAAVHPPGGGDVKFRYLLPEFPFTRPLNGIVSVPVTLYRARPADAAPFVSAIHAV